MKPEYEHDNVLRAAAWLLCGVAGGLLLDLFGKTLFLGALKMIFAPLILASIVAGVTSLPNVRELGSIGIKVFVFYLLSTTVAVSIGTSPETSNSPLIPAVTVTFSPRTDSE